MQARPNVDFDHLQAGDTVSIIDSDGEYIDCTVESLFVQRMVRVRVHGSDDHPLMHADEVFATS